MGALNGAGAVHGNRSGDLSHLEVVDAGGGADEVNDGIDRADLVKVNGFNRNTVEFGFGLGNALEHGEGGVADRGGELGFLEEVPDFRPVPAVMVAVIVVMVVA